MRNEHKRQLEDERAADERYREAVRRRDDQARRVQLDGPANSRWTGSYAPRPLARPDGELVGRVALHRESDLVNGSEFYIGSRHVEEEGLKVFSWTAPIASTFYRGQGDHELCADVALTRTLVRQGKKIVDFFDDHVSGPPLDQPFARRELVLPAPPSRRPIQRKAGTKASKATPEEAPPPRTTRSPHTDELDDRRGVVGIPQPAPPAPPQPASEARTRSRAGRLVLRAEEALRRAIGAPRRERLDSVLATMQSDQYELVTRDPRQPLVIQGHPGTGKTIIAAHRAAYLVHKDAPAERRRQRVLVVGPTPHYVAHIKGVLADLAEPGAVQATSLPEFMSDLRDLPDQVDESLPTNYRDVDIQLGELVERAAHLLRTGPRRPGRLRHADSVAAVYQALRANRVGKYVVTDDLDWAGYLATLPPLTTARRMKRFLPLLACCALSVRPRRTDLFDHIIVDEAQDVTPLEWSLLCALNADKSWTLLGDMNQRRSDWSHHTWKHVAEGLDLADGSSSLRVEQIDRGYRTTSAIMRFAAKLLPRGERSVESLQAGGVQPQIARTRAADVHARAATEALRLLDGHPDGLVAIIGTDRRQSAQALRKRGFTTDRNDQQLLVRDGHRIWVMDAHDVSGLEFDAVVVVEPAAFPSRGFGRHGLLYTSVTRANRELVIVHSAPLPDELRAQRSTSSRKAS